MKRVIMAAQLLLCLLLAAPLLAAENNQLKPYVLASTQPGTIAKNLKAAKDALSAQGFKIAGEYAPYPGAHVLVVTNPALRTGAAKSDTGGYGAAQRVALTEADGKVQVSYTNPVWMGHMYQMDADMEGVAAKLEAALGRQQAFGTEDQWTPKQLRGYNYMIMMPHFTDQITLADYDSQQAALKAVENGLAAHKGGTAKVYRVDVQGKDEAVFGVAIKEGDGADSTVMAVTDTASLKHTAHLPYELLVSGGKVYMLHGKFRIAQSFPDLTMGTFMKISEAPGAIQTALKAAANNE